MERSTTCRCGCGEPVTKLYRPGHDARHVSQLVRVWVEQPDQRDGVEDAVELLSFRLRCKFNRAVGNAVNADERWWVEGHNIRTEIERLIQLPIFNQPEGLRRLAERPPTVKVRQHHKQTRPRRLGTAWPHSNRLQLVKYRGLRWEDLCETMVHELVHLVVGPDPDPYTGRNRFHGERFARTMRTAFWQAYGIEVNRTKGHSYVGHYATALAAHRLQHSVVSSHRR